MWGMATEAQRSRLVVDLDPSEKKKLRLLAAQAERSMSAEVRIAIRDHLDKQTRRSR